MEQPRWIFFDLDDTLWDFSYNSERALNYMYENFPLISEIFNERDTFLLNYHHNNALLWKKFSLGEVDSPQLKIRRWLSTLFNDEATKENIEICNQLDKAYLTKLAEYPDLTEGTKDLLKELSSRFLIGIISNGFAETQYAKLMNSGLWKYITRMIVSDEIKINKPDRRLFEYAIQETGAKEPYLIIGDNLDTDITGAINAGWHAILFSKKIKALKIDDSITSSPLFLGETDNMKKLGEIIRNFFMIL